MKGVGQVEEIAQDLPAVLARDALRVELHAECRAVTMLNPHDEAFVALGADFKLSRRTRTLNDERERARRRKGSVQTPKRPRALCEMRDTLQCIGVGARTPSPPNACPIA